MGMTIDIAIKLMIQGSKYDYDGSAKDFCEAYDMSIEIMRKYQKIQEIVNDRNSKPPLTTLNRIIKVVEDGTENNHHASNT